MIIYKYAVDLLKPMRFVWPSSKVLHVDVQHGASFMWVEHLVDPELSTDKSERRFVVIGTGMSFDPKNVNYVATWQDEPFVWHLYELMR